MSSSFVVPQAPIILVDGSAYLFRAFHALPPLTTSTGQPTGAIKGVLSMLKKIQQQLNPKQMIVVFDAKGKNFRHAQYPAYKANRPPMAQELACQIAPLQAIIRAMGFPLLIETGVEADDVIGTLAQQAAAAGEFVVISSGDKDFAQLVNDRIVLFNSMNDHWLDAAEIEKKYGLPPERFIDYLALLGDKSDNIPGIPGIGEKTATLLIKNLGSIEQMYQKLEQVPHMGLRGGKALQQKLREHHEQALLSYELATIRLDVPLPALSELVMQPANDEVLRQFYQDLELKFLLAELDKVSAQAAIETAFNAIEFELITTEDQWQTWLTALKSAEYFVVDTETTGLDYMSAEIVGISLALPNGQVAYIPLQHDELQQDEKTPQLNREQLLAQFKPLLEAEQPQKVGQNLKYDKSIFANHGIELRGIAFDTMLESYVLNATASRHDMDTLALKHLHRTTISFEDVAGKGAKQKTFNQIEIAQAAPYAAEDAQVTHQLHQCFWPQLQQQPSLQNLFQQLEMPLLNVISRIERTGTCIDAHMLAQQSASLGERLQQLQQQVFEMAGEAFNLESPKQLGEILYQKLKLPILKKTPGGAPSTAEAVLQELALDFPMPHLLMEYRSLHKLKNTYTDKLPKLIHPRTGRIHTSYHQAVTATGRLSSSDPNLQNIPIRTAEGRKIRQAFIAPQEHTLVACDYSQIELRIMAHLSQDDALIRAFTLGQDVHKATAAEVLGKSIEEVTSDERRNAKAINFGLIYGMSAFGLAKQLHIPRYDAQQYIDQYFARYPGVKDYMQRIREQAHAQGYVETLMGRRLYANDINHQNKALQQAAERAAINAPLQGTAADIIKKAMIAVDDWLIQEKLATRMIMQVHDELVLEVPNQELKQILKTVPELMQSVMNLSVPLLVEAGQGLNWDEAH
jgi:DNA polymerase-1